MIIHFPVFWVCKMEPETQPQVVPSTEDKTKGMSDVDKGKTDVVDSVDGASEEGGSRSSRANSMNRAK